MTVSASDDELIASSLESLAECDVWEDENGADEEGIHFEKSVEILLNGELNDEELDDED